MNLTYAHTHVNLSVNETFEDKSKYFKYLPYERYRLANVPFVNYGSAYVAYDLYIEISYREGRDISLLWCLDIYMPFYQITVYCNTR